MGITHRCLWKTALKHFALACRYCGAPVVMEAVAARPCWADPQYRTKSRWAIYRHLKIEHPAKFAAHFGPLSSRPPKLTRADVL